MSLESILIAIASLIIIPLIGIVYLNLTTKLAEQRAAIEANEIAIAAINVQIAKEYLNKTEVRQVFSDLIAPLNGQLGVIQGMLQSMTGGPYVVPPKY